MILLVLLVLIGLLVVYAYLRFRQRPIQLPRLRSVELVLIAVTLQTAVFYWPPKKMLVSDFIAAFLLVTTQMLLLLFIWRNRHWPGLCILGIGLVLNFAVITANGGLMPISPLTLQELTTESQVTLPGSRLPGSKDIVRLPAETKLWWLSDRFVSPDFFSYRAAFSLGDVLIALGAISMMGSLSKSGNDHETAQILA